MHYYLAFYTIYILKLMYLIPKNIYLATNHDGLSGEKSDFLNKHIHIVDVHI